MREEKEEKERERRKILTQDELEEELLEKYFEAKSWFEKKRQKKEEIKE